MEEDSDAEISAHCITFMSPTPSYEMVYLGTRNCCLYDLPLTLVKDKDNKSEKESGAEDDADAESSTRYDVLYFNI